MGCLMHRIDIRGLRMPKILEFMRLLGPLIAMKYFFVIVDSPLTER